MKNTQQFLTTNKVDSLSYSNSVRLIKKTLHLKAIAIIFCLLLIPEDGRCSVSDNLWETRSTSSFLVVAGRPLILDGFDADLGNMKQRLIETVIGQNIIFATFALWRLMAEKANMTGMYQHTYALYYIFMSLKSYADISLALLQYQQVGFNDPLVSRRLMIRLIRNNQTTTAWDILPIPHNENEETGNEELSYLWKDLYSILKKRRIERLTISLQPVSVDKDSEKTTFIPVVAAYKKHQNDYIALENWQLDQNAFFELGTDTEAPQLSILSRPVLQQVTEALHCSSREEEDCPETLYDRKRFVGGTAYKYYDPSIDASEHLTQLSSEHNGSIPTLTLPLIPDSSEGPRLAAFNRTSDLMSACLFMDAEGTQTSLETFYYCTGSRRLMNMYLNQYYIPAGLSNTAVQMIMLQASAHIIEFFYNQGSEAIKLTEDLYRSWRKHQGTIIKYSGQRSQMAMWQLRAEATANWMKLVFRHGLPPQASGSQNKLARYSDPLLGHTSDEKNDEIMSEQRERHRGIANNIIEIATASEKQHKLINPPAWTPRQRLIDYCKTLSIGVPVYGALWAGGMGGPVTGAVVLGIAGAVCPLYFRAQAVEARANKLLANNNLQQQKSANLLNSVHDLATWDQTVLLRAHRNFGSLHRKIAILEKHIDTLDRAGISVESWEEAEMKRHISELETTQQRLESELASKDEQLEQVTRDRDTNRKDNALLLEQYKRLSEDYDWLDDLYEQAKTEPSDQVEKLHDMLEYYRQTIEEYKQRSAFNPQVLLKENLEGVKEDRSQTPSDETLTPGTGSPKSPTPEPLSSSESGSTEVYLRDPVAGEESEDYYPAADVDDWADSVEQHSRLISELAEQREAQNERLDALLKIATRINGEQKDEIKELITENQSLTEQNQALEKRFETLLTELHSFQSTANEQSANSMKAITHLTDKIRDLEAILDSYNFQRMEWEAGYEMEMESTLQQYEESMQELLAENEQLRAENSQLGQTEKENQALTEKLAKAETNNSELKRRLQTLQKWAEAMNQKVDTLTEEQRATLETVNETVERLTLQLENSEKNLQAHISHLRDLAADMHQATYNILTQLEIEIDSEASPMLDQTDLPTTDLVPRLIRNYQVLSQVSDYMESMLLDDMEERSLASSVPTEGYPPESDVEQRMIDPFEPVDTENLKMLTDLLSSLIEQKSELDQAMMKQSRPYSAEPTGQSSLTSASLPIRVHSAQSHRPPSRALENALELIKNYKSRESLTTSPLLAPVTPSEEPRRAVVDPELKREAQALITRTKSRPPSLRRTPEVQNTPVIPEQPSQDQGQEHPVEAPQLPKTEATQQLLEPVVSPPKRQPKPASKKVRSSGPAKTKPPEKRPWK